MSLGGAREREIESERERDQLPKILDVLDSKMSLDDVGQRAPH